MSEKLTQPLPVILSPEQWEKLSPYWKQILELQPWEGGHMEYGTEEDF